MYVAYIKDYVYHLLIELKCKFLPESVPLNCTMCEEV